MAAATVPSETAARTAVTLFKCAERLGAVYNYLAGISVSFDTCAIPAKASTGSANGLFNAALGFVYLVDETGKQNIGRSVVSNRYLPYKRDYETLKPALEKSAREYAKDALNGEENALTTLLTKL